MVDVSGEEVLQCGREESPGSACRCCRRRRGNKKHQGFWTLNLNSIKWNTGLLREVFCSGFSCALLREWPVGTYLSQVSGLRWRSEPANFVSEGEPDLSTLGSVEKATQPDLRVSSSCLPEYRQCLFYLGPFHMGAMGWCQGSHIVCCDKQDTNWNWFTEACSLSI